MCSGTPPSFSFAAIAKDEGVGGGGGDNVSPGKSTVVGALVRAAREASTTREHSARCRFTPFIALT